MQPSIDTVYFPDDTSLLGNRVYRTGIDDLLFVAHAVHPDDRGFFAEVSLIPDLENVIGHPFVPKQVNLSQSRTGVIRGFHAEGWNKFVTVTRGTAFCALVDIRESSSTFGRVETFLIGEDPKASKGSLYIPMGLANSVCALSGPIDYLYFVDKLYRDRDPQGDQAIALFDPDINVAWPIAREAMVLSDRDQNAVTLRRRFPGKFS